MIGNKVANKITKASKMLTENNLETIINKNNKEIPKERYDSSKKWQEIIDELRLM